jgi:hypothetical protein
LDHFEQSGSQRLIEGAPESPASLGNDCRVELGSHAINLGGAAYSLFATFHTPPLYAQQHTNSRQYHALQGIRENNTHFLTI